MIKALKEKLNESALESISLKKKLTEKRNQLEGLEEKFVLGDISKELYNKYSKKYSEESMLLEVLKV